MGQEDKPLFRVSVGSSERLWHNTGMGTMRAVTCELCGKEWPEITSPSESSYSIGRFLGKQFIEECCGKVVDVLFEEFGEVFAVQFLHNFAENPLDPKFGFLRMVLKDVLEEARKKAEAMAAEAQGLQELAEVL